MPHRHLRPSTPPMINSIQYLEDSLELDSLNPGEVSSRLKQAAEKVPIDMLLLGWRLPPGLLEVCQKTAADLGMVLYRWHPLLTGDGILQPRSEWQMVGLDGKGIPGFQNMPEFTFQCPNRPEVRSAALSHLTELLEEGVYQGFFLDRVRFASPAMGFPGVLGCFCPACISEAGLLGLDLAGIRAELLEVLSQPQGRQALIRGVLGTPESSSLKKLLDFRRHSITSLVEQAAVLIHQKGLMVGLDCFSPSLTCMVGQDLAELGRHADWIKVMSYAHTFGPAGMPFELLGLLEYLVAHGNMQEADALELMADSTGLPLPGSRAALRKDGLSLQVLALETRKAVAATTAPVLVGVELMEIEGVAQLHPPQIQADLRAILAEKPAGLALSWDLLHMPLERLDMVQDAILSNSG